MSELKHDGPAPYGPPQTIIEVIESYRDRGLAIPFTTDVLARAGVSDGLVNRTLQTLRLLDLVDDAGFPTPQFELLKRARGEEEYKERLQAWLQDVYREVLQYADPLTDPPSRVAEAFRGFTPDGQRTRMVTLMLGLYRYAGLIADLPTRAEPARPRPRKATASRKAPPATPTPIATRSEAPRDQTSPAVAPRGIGEVAYDLPPGLIGLLQQIPRGGDGWTVNRRDEFVRAFQAVLDFSVPVKRADPERAALPAARSPISD
jgi:hypothetical protein